MSKCPSATGISRGRFDVVWSDLRALGKGRRYGFESTGGVPSTAEADYASKGNLPGAKCIRIRTSETNAIVAYIYPCCWGYSQNHNRTRIGHYWPQLNSAL